MSQGTAKEIASGVGPLLAALIAAYQLWLKPKVDRPPDLPFDVHRLRQVEREVRRVRLQLVLFIALVAVVVLIPVGGTIASIQDIHFDAPISLPKILVALVAAVGLVHVAFLLARLTGTNRELSRVRTRIARPPGPPEV